MAEPRPLDRRRFVLRGLALAAAPLLAGCENGPIVRGAGSEHRQAFRVGLPF